MIDRQFYISIHACVYLCVCVYVCVCVFCVSRYVFSCHLLARLLYIRPHSYHYNSCLCRYYYHSNHYHRLNPDIQFPMVAFPFWLSHKINGFIIIIIQIFIKTIPIVLITVSSSIQSWTKHFICFFLYKLTFPNSFSCSFSF